MATTPAKLPWGLGVNMREAAYYHWGSNAAANLNVTLDCLQEIGVKTVRFFASRIELSADDCAARVVAVLDQLALRKMNAIVCLTDAYSERGFVIKADAPWHNLDHDKGQIHRDYWLKGIYRQQGSYLDFASTVVSKAKSHSNVLVWELGNEFAVLPRPADPQFSAAFLGFVHEAVQKIKSADAKALVSAGLIASGNVGPDAGNPADFAAKLYKLVDVVCVHCYEDYSAQDRQRAIADAEFANGKNFYVGEIGAQYKQGNDRSGYYDNEINFWKTKENAFTVMPWQFDAQQFSLLREDLGVAFDHSDFNNIVQVLKKHA